MKSQTSAVSSVRRPGLLRAKMLGVFFVTFASFVCGQAITGKIVLPDSFGVWSYGQFPLEDTAVGKVYVAGCGAVNVLAGPDGHRSARIDVPSVGDGGGGLFLYPALHKLYTVAYYDTAVTVIDTRTDQVIKTMPMRGDRAGDAAELACLNTRDGKLYVWDMSADRCAVFDLARDTFLYLRLPKGCWRCYNPVSNKVYAFSDSLYIYDAHADTFLKSLPQGNLAFSVACLACCNKVYVTDRASSSVKVIDGAGDSVITDVPTGGGPGNMTMNERDGKVYVCCGYFWAVIDGHTDSVRAVIPAAPGLSGACAWNRATDKVYLGGTDGTVLVLDGVTDSVLARISTGPWLQPLGAVCNSRRNIIYFPTIQDFGSLPKHLTAIDGSADTLLWTEIPGRAPMGNAFTPAVWLPNRRELAFVCSNEWEAMSVGEGPYHPPLTYGGLVARWSGPLVSDRSGQNLYCCLQDTFRARVHVVSCSLHRLVDSIPLPTGGKGKGFMLCVGTRPDRLYCAWRSDTGATAYGVSIVDTRSDTIVRTVACGDIGGNPFGCYGVSAFSDSSGKFYTPNADSLLVIDAQTDSPVKSLPVAQPGSFITSLAWNPISNCVYVATYDQVVKVVDCRTDSVVATVNQTGNILSLAYAPNVNKLFGLTTDGGQGRLAIIDCDRNVVVGNVYVSETSPFIAPVYNARGNKVYFTGHDPRLPVAGWYLVAVDCATNRAVSYVPLAHKIDMLAVDPDSGYVFAGCDNSEIDVIRDQTPAGVATWPSAAARQRPVLRVYPNPALRTMVIEAYAPSSALTTLKVYDRAGRVVATLMSGEFGPGTLQIHWNGTDQGNLMPSGTYYVKLESDQTHLTQKLVLMRQ
jgi:YVTN family beta-propeller protein